MVEALLDAWSSDEAALARDREVGPPDQDDDLWWPPDEVPAGPTAGAPPRLSEVVPSGFSALELDLATADPAGVCDQTVIDGIVGLERVVAWAQARQARLLAEFLTRRGDTVEAFNEPRPSTISSYAPDEVGVALRISRGAALGRLHEACFVVERLPEVLDVWAAGRLDGYKVRIIADAVVFLAPELATAVVARVLPQAPELSHGQLRAALAKAIIAVDPRGANARHRKARKDRRVSVNEQPEGMASLWAYLSAPDARSAWEWLTRLARGLGKDDPRRMDARRADLLVALLTGRSPSPTRPSASASARPSPRTRPGYAPLTMAVAQARRCRPPRTPQAAPTPRPQPPTRLARPARASRATRASRAARVTRASRAT